MNWKKLITETFNKLEEALAADRWALAFTICGELKKLIFSYYEDKETEKDLEIMKE